MIAFLKTNATLLLIGGVFVLLIVFSFKQCNEKRSQTQTNQSVYEAEIIKAKNEVSNYFLTRENAKIDSVKQIEKQKVELVKIEREFYKSEANRLRLSDIELQKKYNKLVAENAPCSKLLESSLEMNDTLRNEVKALTKENVYLDVECESYSNQLYLTEKQNTNLQILLSNSKKEIEADQLVIANYKKLVDKTKKKNKFIHAVGGVVIGVETVLLIFK